jgi:two-component SAPR family response regulator
MKKKKIILFIFALLSSIITCEGAIDYYGLTFRSHEVNQDERTSMCLTPDKPYNLSPGFSLEFDLRLKREILSFGYVFRIISGDTIALDFISNSNTDKISIALVGPQGVWVKEEIKCPVGLRGNNWIHIRVDLSPDEISYSMDDFSGKFPLSFQNFKNIKIYFGRNNHPNFYTTDLPPMSIKDIVLRNNRGQIIREWTLAKHREEVVYDEIKNSKAVVLNGIWDIEQYVQWQNTGAFSIKEENAQIATDPQQDRVFIATRDSLYIYHLTTGQLQRIKTRKGYPFAYNGNRLIYNPKNRQLISYSHACSDFVTYNFETNEWSSDTHDSERQALPLMQHHNHFIDPETDQLILFGGYGNHTYNSNLSIHSEKEGWQVDSLLDGIYPRYLSAAGYWGDGKFLLLGGFGCPSGKQADSPRNLYDLYEVDYKNKKSKKLADFARGTVPHTPGASLVIDTVARKIYTLGYNNEEFQSMIYLLTVDLNTMESTVLGKPIPYRFLDRQSFCDLFLSQNTMKLYAIVLNAEEEGQYTLAFYSLRYPPLQLSDIMQQVEDNPAKRIFILTGILVILLSGGLFLLVRRKKITLPEEIAHTQSSKSSPDVKTSIMQEKPVSTICLLGGFQVFNKQAEDITGSFSWITKQLFVFFLLNSIRNEKGITTNKLDETFWLEMDKTNAANNRNVYIRKLRLLLQTVGDIAIVHENGYWRLTLGKEVTCDYDNAMAFIKTLNKGNSYQQEILKQLLDCTSKGLLLPNISTEWTDDYKDTFSNNLIDLLTKIAAQKEIQNDSKLLLQIANVILVHDCINEEAVQIKCRILYKQGHKGLSKQAFDTFCSSYFNLLGEQPKLKYDDFIKDF